MANQDIGEIVCAWCASDAPVRKRKDGKLYVMCPSCGQQFLNGIHGQDVILERAEIYGAAGVSVNKPVVRNNNYVTPEPVRNNNDVIPVPVVETANEQEQPEPQKQSWFDKFWSEDD